MIADSLPAGDDIQLENGGWFRLHATILEMLAVARFTATEFRAIHFLLRKTYGYNKKEDAIALSQWVEGTNTDKGQISRTLTSLEQKHVIYHIAGVNQWTHVWGFNKYVEQWEPSLFARAENRNHPQKAQTIDPQVNEKPLTHKSKIGKALTRKSMSFDPQVNEALTRKSTTKDNKDNITKECAPHQAMFDSLVIVTRLDTKLKGGQIGKSSKALLKAGYTAADVEQFGKWWKANDFRGKKGDPPTLSQVAEKIPQSKQAKQAVTTSFAADRPDPEIELRRRLLEERNGKSGQSCT